MNDDRSLERAARSWIEAGPTQAPDHVVDAALLLVQTTPQERGLRAPWRLPTMNAPYLRLAGAALAAVVAVGVASFALGPGSNVGGPPAATPTGSPAPSKAPVTTATPFPPTPAPIAPETPLPEPPGDPLPADLIGRSYRANPPQTQGTQELILALRPAGDPHCAAMYDGQSTCFTFLWTPNWPAHVTDPGARGAARIADGNLVLRFDLVPNDLACVGETATYSIQDDGATLSGITTPACTVAVFVQQ